MEKWERGLQVHAQICIDSYAYYTIVIFFTYKLIVKYNHAYRVLLNQYITSINEPKISTLDLFLFLYQNLFKKKNHY